MMKTFTLFWLNGQRETVEGLNPADAMNRAGYGAGAVRALDFYAEGDRHDYEWKADPFGAMSWCKKELAIP